ncbi:MAG: ABC transporter permease [Oscillospiraceae bacterium]|nr:ABC transporter permease [Oscillospiraceae bacterium]
MSVFRKDNGIRPDMTLRTQGRMADIWHRLCENRLAVIGMFIVIILVLVAIFADVLAPYGYNEQNPLEELQFPSAKHWLGTDGYGRDILSRIIYGGRISLLVSLMAVAISFVVGGLLGATAGYFGGAVDTIIMRVMDMLMAIPSTLLAICMAAMLGRGTWQTAIAVAIGGIAPSCRMIRATALTIREQEYVEAARACGSKNFRVILEHIIPNCLAPIIVDATLRLGGNIMMISSLSFIGLGVLPPTAEWGSMLNEGRQYIRSFWPLVTFPGIAIMLTMFGFNVFGDGLRDALDPKMK